jgi:hypothetical protein
VTSAIRRLVPSPDQPLLPIGDFAPAVASRRRVPVRAHLRTVGGVTPPSGAERKEAALDAHESRAVTQRMVAYVRRELRTIYARRLALLGDGAFVTADDVEDVLRLWPECPTEAQPSHGPQHWRGTVFRGKGWRQTGRTVPSRRPHMNATALPTWAPTNAEAP